MLATAGPGAASLVRSRCGAVMCGHCGGGEPRTVELPSSNGKTLDSVENVRAGEEMYDRAVVVAVYAFLYLYFGVGGGEGDGCRLV